MTFPRFTLSMLIALLFAQTDVSLPGNNALPMAAPNTFIGVMV